ncbi:MAG: DNRLRE domain-containing protein [Candidatus Eisenbacteria sp.]|nr:DNRLRE domain-containing protein [Candidatus Eisenbacteria bacterium]
MKMNLENLPGPPGRAPSGGGRSRPLDRSRLLHRVGPRRGRRGRLAPIRSLGLFLMVLCLVLSCTESHEPLDWREAVRGGLGQLDTLVSDSLVVGASHGEVPVITGFSPYLLTGRITRDGEEIRSELYLRWDVSELPEGNVERVHLEFYLDRVDAAGAGSGDFQLRMYPVTSTWSEDSLTLETQPVVNTATALATAEFDTAGLGAGEGPLHLRPLFESESGAALNELIEDWRDDAESNFGVMIRAGASSSEGILRFFSAEGYPASFTEPHLTPRLAIEMADTTVYFQAIDDVFLGRTLSGELTIADSLLLVSTGYVRRSALRFDLSALRGSTPAGEPILDRAVVRGVLHLALEPEQSWSLAADDNLTLFAYEADVDWESGDPLGSAVLIDFVGEAGVAGDDAGVEIRIVEYLQRALEGSGTSLVILSTNETTTLGSILLRGPEASAGKPIVTIVTADLVGRLGDETQR